MWLQINKLKLNVASFKFTFCSCMFTRMLGRMNNLNCFSLGYIDGNVLIYWFVVLFEWCLCRWYWLWTRFIVFWAAYSSFLTPFEFGFFRGLPWNLFLLDIVGQIAFLIDIVLRFLVAYRDPDTHRIVYNPTSIAVR